MTDSRSPPLDLGTQLARDWCLSLRLPLGVIARGISISANGSQNLLLEFPPDENEVRLQIWVEARHARIFCYCYFARTWLPRSEAQTLPGQGGHPSASDAADTNTPAEQGDGAGATDGPARAREQESH